jgi:uncharacterized protein YndB with AHSA1/START domain
MRGIGALVRLVPAPLRIMSSTRITRHIKAPCASVYRALLDPEAVAAWKVPDGMTSEIHEFDAREGGRLRLSLTYDEGAGTGKTNARTDTYHGRFVKLVPDRSVIQETEFETSNPDMMGVMTETITLIDRDGGTDVVLVHENLPAGVSPNDNELGSRVALDKLAAWIER